MFGGELESFANRPISIEWYVSWSVSHVLLGSRLTEALHLGQIGWVSPVW